ncbi:hypothetical protein WDV76_07205 [Xenorhabdus griffiniae]|uniref:hypothetical protein n=1 Tax=Xenorhabdus griffiniae TaxID=351672 RepID=UPI0023596E57|nr:hypothetical protein [Xenorhabdus griffiniae]MDC9605909.1 hypothetical protein [Xenorhabdus griffiniae]
MLSLYTAYDVQHELKDFIKRQRKQQKSSVEDLAATIGQHMEQKWSELKTP